MHSMCGLVSSVAELLTENIALIIIGTALWALRVLFQRLGKGKECQQPVFNFYVMSGFFPNEEFFHNVFFCYVLFVIFGADYKVTYVHCKKINNWKPQTTTEKITCPWVALDIFYVFCSSYCLHALFSL